MSIHAGSAIINEAGRAATLGPLLKLGNSLVSVVAKYALQGQGVVLDRFSKDVLGKVLDNKRPIAPENGIQDIVEILASVSLEKGVATSPEGKLKLFATLADPADHINTPILKNSATGVSVGRITAIDAPFHLLNPRTNEIHKFEGAFEIASVPPEASFAVSGDAGAPLYTAENDLIGILVGTAGGKCYAVPASKLRDRFSFELATFEDLLLHNKALSSMEPIKVVARSREIVALYGDERLRRAEAQLNSRFFGDGMINIHSNAPQDNHLIYRDYIYSRGFAPRLSVQMFVKNLYNRRREFLELASPGLSDCRYNYIGGLTPLFATTGFDKTELEDKLMRVLDTHVREDFPHLAEGYSTDLIEQELPRILKGKAVSATSAWLVMTALSEMRNVSGSDAFQKVWIEPAIFEAKESAAALKLELGAHHKLRRVFDNVFGTVVKHVERFPSFSGTKVIDSIAEGRSVRFITAWAAERAVQLLKNDGYGFRWKRSVHPVARHAAVDDAMSHVNSSAIRRAMR